MIFDWELRSRVWRGMHAWQQLAYRRILVGATVELLDGDTTVQEGTRHAVLHAELGVEGALGLRSVRVLEATAMGPHIDTLDVLGGGFVLAREAKRRVERRMRAPAAGILLDRDARL